MSSPAFEAFLVRIYVDAKCRARFLADPRGEAEKAGLTRQECDALQKIDRVGLELTARSFERKRNRFQKRKRAKVIRYFDFSTFLREILRRK